MYINKLIKLCHKDTRTDDDLGFSDVKGLS